MPEAEETAANLSALGQELGGALGSSFKNER